ncbi:efhc2 [Symbiodinium natans]|uniref:Efhc2 protein n=1 Tax=Symbiodinium natans TaxID=878477 RepID=A0A812HYF8_9DINO|nr:efhc2 [Symbiodinium natans]
MTSTPRSTRSTLPFLPGYSAYDFKFDSRKPQTLSWGPGGSTVPKLNLAIVERLRDPFHRYDMSYRSPTHDEKHSMRESARNTYRPAIPPAWLEHDRQVLKFSAYSQEPVYESPKEAFRIRRCTIYFYLEDGTMMAHASGMDRALVRFTRDFYLHVLGVVLEADQDAPLDSFQASEMEEMLLTLACEAVPFRNLADSHHAQPALDESVDFCKKCESGREQGGRNRYDAQTASAEVLRFNCYWNDHTKYGTRQYYTLHYYLADDTAEILENMSRNSGRDPYPTFYRRSPLRKTPAWPLHSPPHAHDLPIIPKPSRQNISAIPGMEVESAWPRVLPVNAVARHVMECSTLEFLSWCFEVVYKPEDLLVGEAGFADFTASNSSWY